MGRRESGDNQALCAFWAEKLAPNLGSTMIIELSLFEFKKKRNKIEKR
jgi:hypothetical protein